MAVSETEREIAKIVVGRYLTQKESTPRKLLVLKFKQPGLMDLMDRHGILRTDGSRQMYFPLPLAFHYSGNPEIVNLAKSSVEIVLHVLQNLFEVELTKTEFTREEIETHARKMYDSVSPEKIALGLYLVREFGVLSGWAPGGETLNVMSVRIAESIVTVKSIDQAWDEHIARQTKYIEQDTPTSNANAATAVEMFETPHQFGASELDWGLIHPEVVKISQSRFETRHYADAVEAALKHVNQTLRDLVKARTGNEYDGSALMQKAFSADKPVLRLDDLNTVSGKNIQVGYQQIFSGAMTGIRNPKAHGNIEIDPVRAIHLLFLASLLMSKLDEALALEKSSSRAELAGGDVPRPVA